jgi:hypothetical protein
MVKVDVHILRSLGEREDWFQHCLESLEREPVNIHVLEGVPDHIGKGRKAGLQAGTEPYVAYVDPDDLVCRGAFQACIDALQADASKAVAYTGEARVSKDGVLLAAYDRKLYEPFFGTPDEALRAHHLCVYRRTALPNLNFLDDFPFMPEQALKTRLWNHNFVYVDRIGYQWRQHQGGASKRRWASTPEMGALLARQSSMWKRLFAPKTGDER